MTSIDKIELFSSKTCAPCVWIKAKFKQEGTKHIVIDVDENPEEFERAMRITGQSMKPQLLIHQTVDGEPMIDSIVGLNPGKIAAIAKYNPIMV